MKMELKNMLKVFLAVIVVITATFNLQAQRKRHIHENLLQHDLKPYHFGFSLGFNRMDFALRPVSNFHEFSSIRSRQSPEFDTLYSVLTQGQNGFNIGIVSNLKLAPQWDLRFIPTLTFGDRNIIYEGVKNNDPNYRSRTQQIESTFLDFPLHLKYKSVRMANTRVYVIGGLKYSHDLASVEDRDDQEEELLVRARKNDVYYEMGVGFEYYFEFFKFSTEIKASFGLFDILAPENSMFANSIDRLNSKILMVSFMFE
jgi:hypothetical protein